LKEMKKLIKLAKTFIKSNPKTKKIGQIRTIFKSESLTRFQVLHTAEINMQKNPPDISFNINEINLPLFNKNPLFLQAVIDHELTHYFVNPKLPKNIVAYSLPAFESIHGRNVLHVDGSITDEWTKLFVEMLKEIPAITGMSKEFLPHYLEFTFLYKAFLISVWESNNIALLIENVTNYCQNQEIKLNFSLDIYSIFDELVIYRTSKYFNLCQLEGIAKALIDKVQEHINEPRLFDLCYSIIDDIIKYGVKTNYVEEFKELSELISDNAYRINCSMNMKGD